MGDNSHTIELRVRYKETDKMGVVYYSNYLVWFEVARTEFFRSRGADYREIEDRHKVYLPVVESYCRYRAPLRYDDLVRITAKLTGMSGTRVTFEYEVAKDGAVTATGRTVHAFVNAEGSPVPVPDDIRKQLSS